MNEDVELVEGLHQQVRILEDLYQRTVGDPEIPLVCSVCYLPELDCSCDIPALYTIGVVLESLQARLEMPDGTW